MSTSFNPTMRQSSRKVRICSMAILPLVSLLFVFAPIGSAVGATLKACNPAALKQAIATAKPGDSIQMCNRQWADTVIDFNVNATKAAPIRLVAETPGDVVLTGSSRLLVSGNYAIVDGLLFQGGYTGIENSIVEFRSLNARNCDNCRITNLSVILGFGEMFRLTPTCYESSVLWRILYMCVCFSCGQ